MVLESTMICVDDSDYMRNGDFVPTRMAAVQDAVSIISHTKTRANPENNVGLLTLASSEVLTTLTTDAGKLMSKMLAVQPCGDLKLMSGLRVAHLALKHRQGKNHKMRIIVFIGSPIEDVDKAEFIRLAKRLKKEKVNVDIVSFGEDKGNQDVLNEFVDTLNGKDDVGSHLLVVPPGPTLTDALVQSPILQSEDGSAPVGGGGGFDFGVDPNDDPELALALRVSMEEQRARQEAEARANPSGAAAEGPTNEEQMLEKALAMSMDGNAAGASGSGSVARSSAPAPDFSQMTEEEQIAYAMQMSMQETATAKAEGVKPTQDVQEEAMDFDDTLVVDKEQGERGVETALQDTEYLQSVLEGLPAAESDTNQSPNKKPGESTKKKPEPKPSPKKK